MAATDPAPFHVGLTPERVVDAAVELTRETHLMSWSIRDLAARLGIAASGIYHHVGGKDLLCRAVVERMLERIALPDPRLPWQEWFRVLLYSAGPTASEYPGTAKWMLMHGPTLPAVLPVLEAGMSRLGDAGFGERAAFAYAALLNNAMLSVSMGDDRLQHEEDGPRDHATMMAEFRQMATASDHVRAMGQEFIGRFAQGGQAAARMRWEYYRFVVDTTIAGLDATLSASGAVTRPGADRR
ncbi:TetR/AcrR family transcriptional regulator [Microbacterium sp. No. 7]|uniref:TetR/AcrR family transcriptional regulator n=1 Tax=Microbacterium sp. No. 7 TaxID=1714373 RepID=UPI0006D018D9|nr:TetR family transcriptional regulator [Microbacterium sp. No. 7]ALJ19784.1 TetR family transcriptional regulator [Microbacterium sp. No. 7]